MARVWVKGFTKSDGTKVKGHYRDVAATTTIRDNEALRNFASSISPNDNLYGVRTKKSIKVFSNKKAFKNASKKATGAYGRFSSSNFNLFRF